MKKLALTLLASFIGVQATFAAEPAVIVPKKGKMIKTTKLTADDAGTLTYALPKKGSGKMKKKDYKYAWLPYTMTVLPKIDAAASKGASEKIIGLYLKYGNIYKFLGWDIYCKNKAARGYIELNQLDKALALVEPLLTAKTINPKRAKHLDVALGTLASIYVKSGASAKATALVPKLVGSSDDEVAASALITQGDIYLKEGKLKDAVLSYLQPALLFDKKNTSRAEALYKAVVAMKKMNDTGRSKKFAEMLKADYPKSEFATKL